MEAALRSGATCCIGIARPLVMNPDLPREMLAGQREFAESYSLVGLVAGLRTGALFDLFFLLAGYWLVRQTADPSPEQLVVCCL
jgi:hypothetical protein